MNFGRVRESIINLFLERTTHKVVAQVCALLGNRVNHKSNLVFIRMILKQFHRCLARSEHWRNEDYLKVDLVDVLRSTGALGQSCLVQRRIDELCLGFQRAKLLGLSAMRLDDLLMLDIKWRGGVPDQEHCGFLKVVGVRCLHLVSNLLHEHALLAIVVSSCVHIYF